MFDLFKYKNGYNFLELKRMAEIFKTIHLPGLKDYNVMNLLGEYIFGISMSRFPIGLHRTIRRLIGCLFTYTYDIHGNGKNVFVFTGDGAGRPDYVRCLEKVASQCESYVIIKTNRRQLRMRPLRLFSLIQIMFWAFKLNKIVKKFYISCDMAAALYRAKKSAELLNELIMSIMPSQVTVFCDAWACENALVQLLKKENIRTATLQHGNGTDIFLGVCSDYYLANSLLSRNNAIKCGIPSEKIIVTGPMKYAGDIFENKNTSLKTIGVVFDGAQNLQNNLEMIDIVHDALGNKQCCIRFHPNNKREDYKGHIHETDCICDSLEEFENRIDLCIVYNSSMFTDMIYKKNPVVRYKNGKVDLFPELSDKGFTNSEELKQIILEFNNENFKQSQIDLYNKVYGDTCNNMSYKNYFNYAGNRNA